MSFVNPYRYGAASNVDTDYFTEALALDNLEFFYKFDEASGTLADSVSTLDFDNIVSAPTYGQDSLIPSQAETCIKLGTGVSAITTNTVPAAIIGDVDWTWFGWIGGEFESGGSPIFWDYNAGAFNPYFSLSTANGKYILVGEPYASPNPVYYIDNTNDYQSGPYGMFFAVVRDGTANTLTPYQNGIAMTAATGHNMPAGGAAGVMEIRQAAISLQGCGMTSDKLTPAEILELYYAGVAGNTAGPA